MSQTDLHILLVNGDDEVRSKIRATLNSAGFTQISEASSGREAVKYLREETLDLMITDIEIGDLDGWRLSRMIRSDVYKCDSNLPIIVVTKTWCERIAEVTGREFSVNALLCIDCLETLPMHITNSLDSDEVVCLPRVLVVEDHPDTANIARRVLKQRFKVEIATDGEQGLNAWKEGRHDLVLLDVMLPKMSGPDVLAAIIEIHPQQPVVIMTAYSTMDMAEKLMLKGAVDFVAKPFRAEQLRRVCELAVRREDYMISNSQFAARVQSLEDSTNAYRQVSEDHQRLLDNLSTVVLELDQQGNLLFLSKAWTRLTGHDIEESLGKPLTSFLSSDFIDSSQCQHQIQQLVCGDSGECKLELSLSDCHGRSIWSECKLDAITTESGTTIFGCLDDISQRKRAQKDLEFMAMHDKLTGLHNRHFFDSSLRQMAASCSRDDSHHALLYLDLDHFKVINDTFGHNHGDIVLRDISSLLSRRIRQSDILCRIGGDEFAVLLTNTDLAHAQVIAEQIRLMMCDFQHIQGGHNFEISASFGLCAIDGKSSSSIEYMKQADIALYVAKRRGRNLIHVYNPEDKESEELRSSIDWARRFKKALNKEQVVLHFQPVLHIESSEIAHYEALIRLELPGEGLIYPGVFIPALEHGGDMAMLDHWVIKKVIQLLSLHPQLHKVAINLSGQAFRDESLVAVVEDALKTYNVAASRIIFELTESASMANGTATQHMISSLHALGCKFALDDFGTGFSTFSYLKQFPAECVKVDGSFISNLDQCKEDQALVRAISEVSRALGKETVAEFVESQAVLDILQEIGIDYAQGFHIGRPMTIDALITFQIDFPLLAIQATSK